MAEIKVEETQFFCLLNFMEQYIENTKEHASEEILQMGQMLEAEINQYRNVRILMTQRKAYYEFYSRNKKSNPEQAKAAYERYRIAQEELHKIRG